MTVKHLIAVFAFLALPALAEPAPAFELKDSKGETHTLAQYKGSVVVLEWVNHGCPFVQKHYKNGHMQKLQEESTARGVVWLSVCSSAKGKQGYMTPEEQEKTIADKGIKATAVLLDTEGTTGKAYGAKTTPHMYVIDAAGNLVYKGGIDSISSTNPDDIAKATNYVKQALDEVLGGKPVSVPESKPYGCSVKY